MVVTSRPFAHALGTRRILTRGIGLLALFLVLANARSYAAESDPSLADVLKHLREWRRSFATIRVTWHQWSREQTLEGHPDLDPKFEPDGSYYTRYEFAWADWGAFRVESISHEAGQPIRRQILGNDGMRPWSAVTERKKGVDIQSWARLEFWKPDPARPLESSAMFSGMYGLWNSSGHWVDEYLARAENCRLGGYEDVEGHRCAVVKIVRDMTEGRAPSPAYPVLSKEETYWLDAEFGFLPRKYREMTSLFGQEKPQHAYTWIAPDFRKIDERLWFPARGDSVMGPERLKRDTVQWSVKQVVLNESLARTFFQAVEPSHGTQVFDRVNMKGYRARGGGATDEGSASPPSDSGEGGEAVQAKPWSFPWRWVGLGAAVVLAVGIVFRWRQRGSRRP